MMDEGPKGWINGDESAREMLGRVLSRRPVMTLPPPLHRVPVRAGNVVEISGASPSAKTLLLIQAAANCILPTEWNGVYYGGLGQLVLYIDLDCRFEASRLVQVLRSRIVKSSANGFCNEEELLSLCLGRFSYVRCYDSLEFLATLKTLPLRLQKEGRVQLLLIDNVGAFHWVDRAYAAASPLEFSSNRKSLSLQSLWESAVHDIRKLLLVHPMLVIASKAAVYGSTPNEGERHFRAGRWAVDVSGTTEEPPPHRKHNKFREYMPSTWQAFVTHRVLVRGPDEHHLAAAAGHHRPGQPEHLLEWLLPAVSASDKFVVRDAGAFLVQP